MSYIADVLEDYIGEHADYLIKELSRENDELLNEIGGIARKLWVPLNSMESAWPGKIGAVDGGSMSLRLDNGGALIITSAYGFCEDFEERLAECAIVYPPSTYYVSILRQKLELRVARKLITKLGQRGLLLLDGSLYGLLSKPPITPIHAPSNYGSLLLDFYSEITNLLKEASDNRVWLASISKVSSSRFMRDYAIYLIHQKETERLKNSYNLEPKDLQSVETLLYELFRSPMKAFVTVKRLKAKYGIIMKKIELIAREVLIKTPDLFLLKHYTEGVGYTKPLLLGPSSRLRDSYNNAISDPQGYTVRRLLLAEEYSNKVREILQGMMTADAIASFYVRLNHLDHPLKVDMPVSNLGLHRNFFDVSMPEFLENIDIDELILSLKAMYGNKEVYNVWLYEADRRARLQKEDLKTLIEILERKLGPVELARRAL